MQKILTLSFVVVLAALNGCANPCDAAADTIEAKNDECGVDSGEGEGEGEGEEEECTEEDGTDAECFAKCYTDADCEGIFGADDYDVDSDAATTFNECIADCV